MITKLKKNEIFVFGSNLAGRHGKGAAKYALKFFGAVYGQGIGIQGQSFAVPTKDEKLKVLSKTQIKSYVNKYLFPFVKKHSKLTFYLTRIGCGLAGYSDEEMIEIFKIFKDFKNVIFPPEWKELL